MQIGPWGLKLERGIGPWGKVQVNKEKLYWHVVTDAQPMAWASS